MERKRPASVSREIAGYNRAITRCKWAIAAEKKRLQKGLPQENPLAPSLDALEQLKAHYEWLKHSIESSWDSVLGQAA